MQRRTREAVQGMAITVFALVGIFCRLEVGGAAEPDTPGKWAYLKYCGACHGADGKGTGAAAGFMRPKPTDLTQLAKQAGGTFPYAATMQAIDGTKMVPPHGDANMPVWGEIFRLESGASMERRAHAQGRIMLITEYIRSIQEK